MALPPHKRRRVLGAVFIAIGIIGIINVFISGPPMRTVLYVRLTASVVMIGFGIWAFFRKSRTPL